MRDKNHRAFTLIELLVVVAIIGILAAVGVVAYNGYTSSAKVNATKSNFDAVYKYISAEVLKCEIGNDNIFEGYRPCSGFNDTSQINAMIDSYGHIFFSNFTNPYTGIKNCQTSATNCMVRGSNEYFLGKISLDAVSSNLLIFKLIVERIFHDNLIVISTNHKIMY